MFESPTLVSTAEAADALGVSIKTITRWVTSKKLTPITRLPGKRGAMFFDGRDIEALLAQEPWEPAS